MWSHHTQSVREIFGKMDASGKRFAIVVSRFNEYVTKPMLEGAVDELHRHGADPTEVIHVSGTWEIPVAASALLARGADIRPNGIIALGCILQGATIHAQLLAQDVAEALARLQTDHQVPIAWGVLTPESPEQAIERSGMKMGNKGREAALAAIDMASVLGQLRE